MSVEAGLAELRAAPYPVGPVCDDCGKEAKHGTVMLTMSATVRARAYTWQVCSNCWRRECPDCVAEKAGV